MFGFCRFYDECDCLVGLSTVFCDLEFVGFVDFLCRMEGGEKGGKGDENRNQKEKVPYLKLFSFGDRLDVALMVVGSLAAAANGLSMPLMTVVFGQLIDSFGTSDRSKIVHSVSQVIPQIFYFFIFLFFKSFGFVLFHIWAVLLLLIFLSSIW